MSFKSIIKIIDEKVFYSLLGIMIIIGGIGLIWLGSITMVGGIVSVFFGAVLILYQLLNPFFR